MALSMNMELDSGVTITYWKAFYDSVDTKKLVVQVSMRGFLDQAASDAGKAPLKKYIYVLDSTQVTFEGKVPTLASVYAFWKTIDGDPMGNEPSTHLIDWTGAVDA